MAHVHWAVPALPPPVHVWCAPQAVGMFHDPCGLQVCGPLGEHVVSPGVHWPWQVPMHALQTPVPVQYGSAVGQGVATPHAPFVHVCTLLPEQRFSFGLHTDPPSASAFTAESPTGVVESGPPPMESTVESGDPLSGPPPSSPPPDPGEKSPRTSEQDISAKNAGMTKTCEALDMKTPPLAFYTK
jgi:hypothetical protein